MKLYKFRPFEQLEYILDIVLNERLFCAEYRNLNDPFEGMFHSVLPTPIRFTAGSPVNQPLVQYTETSSVEDLYAKLEQTRVCSLSKDVGNAQLWSLYAGGHTGVAIEIDFAGLEHEIHKVVYSERLPRILNTRRGKAGIEKVLKTKTKAWKYESEYRLISDQHWYSVESRIKRVIVGHRTSADRSQLLRRLLPKGVVLYKASLDYENARVRA